MRHIEYSNAFKRDWKREARGRYRKLLMKGGELDYVKDSLAMNMPLPIKYHDQCSAPKSRRIA